MINFSKLLSRDSGKGAVSVAPPADELPKVRTEIEVQAELDFARASIEPLRAKLKAARQQVETAQYGFDLAAKAFALGQTAAEPDRGELQAAIALSDALRRVSSDQERIITRLGAELAAARLAEATAIDSDRLPLLIASAEAAYDEFARAASEFRRAESVLFSALFDTRTGLRQQFTASDVQFAAKRAMCTTSVRAQELARKHGLFEAIHANFETHGEENLGRAQMEFVRLHYGRM